MHPTMQKAEVATPRETLADVRPRPVKAELKAQVPATAHPDPQAPATTLREVAADALRKTTSQKAAATDIGIHEGRLSHKLQDGTLTLAQLESLGPTFAAELGQRLMQTYGNALEDPKARLRRVVREVRQKLDEIEQYAEFIG